MFIFLSGSDSGHIESRPPRLPHRRANDAGSVAAAGRRQHASGGPAGPTSAGGTASGPPPAQRRASTRRPARRITRIRGPRRRGFRPHRVARRSQQLSAAPTALRALGARPRLTSSCPTTGSIAAAADASPQPRPAPPRIRTPSRRRRPR